MWGASESEADLKPHLSRHWLTNQRAENPAQFDHQVETKLLVPPVPAANVSRPRLIAQLDRGLQPGQRLLLVAAPAGYGKTTLLCEWAGQASLARFGWLALDEGDNGPAQFWNYLANALGRHIPNLREPVLTLLHGDPLRKLPTDMHLAITSRSEPPLELARLRARGQLTEIQMDALSFSEGESAVFLNAAMGLALPEVDVAALNRRAEGWIAGLQLAAVAVQAIRQRADDVARFIQSFGEAHRQVMTTWSTWCSGINRRRSKRSSCTLASWTSSPRRWARR